jgi:hypothetical protein
MIRLREVRLTRPAWGLLRIECLRPARRLFISGLAAAAMLLASASARAQEQQQQQASQTFDAAVADAPVATASAEVLAGAAWMIDEFGRVGGCDHSARLDNFAVELQQNPDRMGYILVYGPAGKANGSAYYRGGVTRDYLVNSRGINPARLVVINGGRYQRMGESITQLWVVPRGADPPQPVEYENKIATFRGLFTEYEDWDGIQYYDAGTGPPVGNAQFAGFVDAVSSQPETRVYIVAFNGEDSAPGAWRRVAAQATTGLEREGIDSGRVSVIFGGKAKKLKVQLWVAAADAPPPVRDAGPEPSPSAAAQLGSFDHYMLQDEENQQYVVKGLGDVLKADQKLIAYVFIREAAADEETEAEATGEEAEDAAAGSDGLTETGEETAADEVKAEAETAAGDEAAETEEPAEVDMDQLVESWRKELREKYSVADYRVIVIKVPPRGDWETASIETWVVPPGAAAPDPLAVPSELEVTDETIGEEKSEGASENGSDSSDPDGAQAVRGREV